MKRWIGRILFGFWIITVLYFYVILYIAPNIREVINR